MHYTTGDPRATSVLVQRLALDVQRENVAYVMATLPLPRTGGNGSFYLCFNFCVYGA